MFVLYCFFCKLYGYTRELHVLTHSFPSRRSSDPDLRRPRRVQLLAIVERGHDVHPPRRLERTRRRPERGGAVRPAFGRDGRRAAGGQCLRHRAAGGARPRPRHRFTMIVPATGGSSYPAVEPATRAMVGRAAPEKEVAPGFLPVQPRNPALLAEVGRDP